MTEGLTPIIQAEDLLKLDKLDDLVLIDASNGLEARANYEEKHLKGACFVSLEKQLSDIKSDFARGGRHPLPKTQYFSEVLSQLGISPKSHVVIYDNNKGANSAARFWWMLKSVGHEKVQVLNGGMEEAEKLNFPVSSKPEVVKKTEPYILNKWQLPHASIEEVEKASQNEDYLVIDVRDPARYRGEVEPIDLIAGHIPRAINIPFKENLDQNGLFLPAQMLKVKYENVFGNMKSNQIIVHCGSGVTACHSLLAIAQAGLKIPKLYVGSWSEWSRNNKPIEKTSNF